MRSDVRRRHDAQLRTKGVCTEHSAIFDTSPGGQDARTALASQVDENTRLLVLQQRSIEDRRDATLRLQALRDQVPVVCKAVINAGRRVQIPGTAMQGMRLPNGVSDDELLAYCGALLDRVTPYADAFLAAGLPPDVLKNLADLIQQVATAKNDQAAARQRFGAAAVALRENQKAAEHTIATLESLAVANPAAHPEVVTKLRIAKRIGPHASAPAVTPAPAPVPPSTTPTSTSAERAV